MKYGVLLCGLLGCLVTTAEAASFLCEKAGRIPLVRLVPSQDAATFTPQSGESCVTLTKTTIGAQLALWNAAPRKEHLKLEGEGDARGLVEMTAAEKQAVNEALAAPNLALQPFRDELRPGGGCADLFVDLETKIDTYYDTRHAANKALIDAATNIATAKTAMTAMNDTYSEERIGAKKLARCLTALIKVLRQDR